MDTEVSLAKDKLIQDFIKTDVNFAKEKLVQDFKITIADTEELLKATAMVAGEKAASARKRIQESLGRAKSKLIAVEEAVLIKANETAGATDAYVHENTWQAVGIFAGIGLLIGLLIRRR